ncbi:MAG TPA: hypothetical protein VIG52_05835, partial [Methyloceanibacter sp.]
MTEARAANARSAHPVHAGLAIEYAEIGTARRDWPNAAARWRAVLDLLAEAAPPDAHASLGQAYENLREVYFHRRCARGAVPGLSGRFVLLGAHAVSAAVV